MASRPFRNKLNNLEPKTWLKFQKSWFVHNPPRRRKEVLRHPAKFPETLAQEFIEFFTKQGQVVLDPMAGSGSSLVAALRSGRHSFGIELNPEYAKMAEEAVEDERTRLDLPPFDQENAGVIARVILGNAADIAGHVQTHNIPPIDYVITSPPYWDMLRAHGAETQRVRRQSENLDVYYSEDDQDLGNISDYELFLQRLSEIYTSLKPFLKSKAYMTIIVKNVKKGGVIYPLAWDLARNLSHEYTLKDERIWCQDDIRLAPYGLGNAWVSNTFHHYCLQFRKD